MQPVKSFKVEEVIENFKEKIRIRKNVESVTKKGTLTRSVEAPAGTARRQATETVTVPTRKMREEEHKVVTEVDKNLPQDKGTSQNKEEILLTLRKTKAEGRETTGRSQMTLMNLEQLTQIDQTDLTGQTMMMNHLKKERNQSVGQEKVVVKGTIDSLLPISPDVLEAEPIPPIL